jgi:hypothetical protein
MSHTRSREAIYSSVRRRATGLVTFTPSTFALHMENGLLCVFHDDFEDIPLNNSSPLSAADSTRNLSSERLVMHEKQVEFSYVVD